MEKRILWVGMMAAVFLVLGSGCAGVLPVPGGGEDVNRSFYSTQDDLLHRLRLLLPGMSEQDVFNVLGHGKEDLVRLERDQIVTALYGSTSVEFQDGAPGYENAGVFLQSLNGYRLYYKIVSRTHGFKSPIRIRTDEMGFDYAVTLVFKDGLLYERPILTGGKVNRSSSATIFDYLTPGVIIDRTVP